MATFVIGFALLPLVNPLLDVVSPLNITRPKKFIYPAEMLVDHEKYYYILLTIMYYGYFMACVVTLAIDTIYFAFIEHACALFDILNYHLKNIVQGRSKQEAHHDSSSKQNNIVQHLIRCILLHIKIKAFIELINSTFAIYLFFEVSLGFVMHCTLCTMSVLQINKAAEIIIYVALVVCQTARLFFYGWQGQQITDHSIDVYISAYNGAWYETSNTAKKMLLMLIIRSQIISEIKVAKSFVMNLENFTVVIILRASIQDFRFNTNQSGMDVFDTRYFRVNKFLLSFFGLWPMQSTSNKNKRLCCTLFGILILLLPQIAFLFKRMRRLNDFYDVLPTFLGTCICLLKTIGLQMLIQHVCHDWCLLAKYNDIWILMEYMERSRMFTLVFLIALYASWLFYSTPSIAVSGIYTILPTNKTYTAKFLYRIEHVLDIDKYFELLMLHGFISVFYIVSVVIAVDTTFTLYTQHICALFECLRMLVLHVHHDWCLSAKYNDIWILMEYMERNRIFTLVYSIFASTGIASFVTTPLTIPLVERILMSNVTRSKRMPHPTEFFLDMEKYYYILLAITFVGYAVCGMIVIATDTIYFALLQHTCGTLAILSYRLTAYDKSKKCFNRNPTSKGDTDVENMVHCIQLQIRIERLIYLIETTFAICLFTDVGLGVLLQCCGCVRIVTRTELARNGPLVLIQSIRSFFTSWLGQKIIDHSSQISVAAYNGIWYQMSLEAKKMLLLFIMKCQKPYHITVAKLYAICLETYSSYLRKKLFRTDIWQYLVINILLTIARIAKCGIYTILPTNKTYTAKFPYRIEHVLDIDKYFELLMLHGFISVFYIVSVVIAIDTTFALYTQHICALFECLRSGSVHGILYGEDLLQASLTVMLRSRTSLRSPHGTYKNKFGLYLIHPGITFLLSLLICSYYVIIIIAQNLSYTLTPVVTSGMYKILPTNKTYDARFLYRLEHVLDMDKYFNMLMLHGFISVFYVCHVPIALDTTYTLCIQHICALFECLRYNIERIQSSDFVFLQPNIEDDEAYCHIIDCIKSYKHVLKLVLMQALMCARARVCVCVLDKQPDEIIRVLSGNLMQVLHIYLLSLISQKLIDHSSGLQNVIYSCDWYKISMRSKDLLRFTLLRTTKPCQIKAGKLFIMSMENFSSVCAKRNIILLDVYNRNINLWGLIAGIADLSIIMENTSPLLVCTFIITKLINSIIGLYAMWLFYTTPPIIVSGIYTLLPTNETYSARFLYRLEHVLDMDKYYNLLMLHGFISVFYIVSVPIAVDSLFTLCIQHVCALFRCIK
ncbi:Odorant receptor Or2 [Trachymyrmex cornetzi]|uniref:Odorant receptor Or2 n=1 Tax=Trachymyrmex cornetzi TaxID=471704 RepID=A0A151JM23_9HYME|nr:Odorant receptor Or2 [Trachymyrmex cornetzi]